MTRAYSAVVGESYTIIDGAVAFDDGVKYSLAETKVLKGATPDALILVHHIKRIFGGEVRLGTRA